MENRETSGVSGGLKKPEMLGGGDLWVKAGKQGEKWVSTENASRYKKESSTFHEE